MQNFIVADEVVRSAQI